MRLAPLGSAWLVVQFQVVPALNAMLVVMVGLGVVVDGTHAAVDGFQYAPSEARLRVMLALAMPDGVPPEPGLSLAVPAMLLSANATDPFGGLSTVETGGVPSTNRTLLSWSVPVCP